MFSDDSARVGTYDTFYGYGTVGTVGTARWVRWVRYGGYRTVPTVPTVPYPPYPPCRTHCTHRTVPPYPTYRTLHRTIIFEDRTPSTEHYSWNLIILTRIANSSFWIYLTYVWVSDGFKKNGRWLLSFLSIRVKVMIKILPPTAPFPCYPSCTNYTLPFSNID